MATHQTVCAVCGADACCTSDEHILGVGGGCGDKRAVEFCSVACFNALRKKLRTRAAIARHQHPTWEIDHVD
jgi:hypothetical protein